MSTNQAAYASPRYEWLPSQPVHHVPYVHVEALERAEEPPLDCWAACFPCVVEAS